MLGAAPAVLDQTLQRESDLLLVPLLDVLAADLRLRECDTLLLRIAAPEGQQAREQRPVVAQPVRVVLAEGVDYISSMKITDIMAGICHWSN